MVWLIGMLSKQYGTNSLIFQLSGMETWVILMMIITISTLSYSYPYLPFPIGEYPDFQAMIEATGVDGCMAGYAISSIFHLPPLNSLSTYCIPNANYNSYGALIRPWIFQEQPVSLASCIEAYVLPSSPPLLHNCGGSYTYFLFFSLY